MKRSLLVAISGISFLAFLITGAMGEVLQSPKAKDLAGNNKQMNPLASITPPASAIVETNTDTNWVYVPVTNLTYSFSVISNDWYYLYGTTNFQEKPWIKWHDVYHFQALSNGIFSNNWNIITNSDKMIKIYHLR